MRMKLSSSGKLTRNVSTLLSRQQIIWLRTLNGLATVVNWGKSQTSTCKTATKMILTVIKKPVRLKIRISLVTNKNTTIIVKTIHHSTHKWWKTNSLLSQIFVKLLLKDKKMSPIKNKIIKGQEIESVTTSPGWTKEQPTHKDYQTKLNQHKRLNSKNVLPAKEATLNNLKSCPALFVPNW